MVFLPDMRRHRGVSFLVRGAGPWLARGISVGAISRVSGLPGFSAMM